MSKEPKDLPPSAIARMEETAHRLGAARLFPLGPPSDHAVRDAQDILAAEQGVAGAPRHEVTQEDGAGILGSDVLEATKSVLGRASQSESERFADLVRRAMHEPHGDDELWFTVMEGQGTAYHGTDRATAQRLYELLSGLSPVSISVETKWRPPAWAAQPLAGVALAEIQRLRFHARAWMFVSLVLALLSIWTWLKR